MPLPLSTSNEHLHAKHHLRKLFLEKRRMLVPEEEKQQSQALCTLITTVSPFQNAKHIAIYWPFDHEISLAPLLCNAACIAKQFYLPVLQTAQDILRFTAYTPHTPLIQNHFGFQEPSIQSTLIAPKDLDLICLPLVAFDKNGQRLGRGQGHYDKALAFLQNMPRPTKPFLLGLAYDFQETETIPSDPWDILLDGVLTNLKFSAFPKVFCKNYHD